MSFHQISALRSPALAAAQRCSTLTGPQHRMVCALPQNVPGTLPVTEEHRRYIRRALELAKTAEGKTHPNPIVGCVIVKDGKIVGEGYHPKAGKPHAEVYALRAAGSEAHGATAYVTLEPCNHYGRTPPCSEALVAAGVEQVVVGCLDPNVLVASAGVATLLRAGIQVVLVDGEENQACYSANEEFMERMKAQAAAAGTT